MNNTQVRNIERTDRVISYIDTQPEEFAEGSKVVTLCTKIKQERAKLAEFDVVRSSSMSKRKQGTVARQNMRKLLSNLVNSVTDTAEVIALDHTDFKGMFVRPQKNAGDLTLIADARAFADKVAPVVGLFVENGLPATFINDLRSYADSLEHSIQLQTGGVGERVRTNAEIERTIKRLNELIERLDVNVRNKYTSGDPKLIAWESARRLEQPARTNRSGGNNAPPPAQP